MAFGNTQWTEIIVREKLLEARSRSQAFVSRQNLVMFFLARDPNQKRKTKKKGLSAVR
jgi:hypothetical protein